MLRHRTHHAPYAPRRGYIIPLASLALSLPSLVAIAGLRAIAIAHALTGYSLSLGAPMLHSPVGFAALVCYIVFGPILGFILCLSQRGLAEQLYGSGLLLGYRMKRLNTSALALVGTTTGALILLVFLLFTGKALSGG